MPCAVPADKVHVVILYERLACVAKAMAAYAHLARALAGEFIPDFRVWRLDDALKPARALEAARDIASAGVIIMAVNGHQPCPRAFQLWMKPGENGGDGGPPRAIYAFTEETDETDPGPAAASWINVVRRSTTQISDGIFVYEPPPVTGGGAREQMARSAPAAQSEVMA